MNERKKKINPFDLLNYFLSTHIDTNICIYVYMFIINNIYNLHYAEATQCNLHSNNYEMYLYSISPLQLSYLV